MPPSLAQTLATTKDIQGKYCMSESARPSLRRTVHTLQNTGPLLPHLQPATGLDSSGTGRRTLNLNCTKFHTKRKYHETFMKQNLRNPLYPSHTHDKLNLTSFNAHIRIAIDAASLSQSNPPKPQEISWSTLPSYYARQNFRKLCSELKQPDTIQSSAARLIMYDLNTTMPHMHKGKHRKHTSISMSKLKKWMPSTTTENERKNLYLETSQHG